MTLLSTFFKYHYFFIFLLFLGLSPITSKAQRTCGTDLAVKNALEKHPELVKKYQKIKENSFPDLSALSYMRGTPDAVIPVVVHVVLQNPSQITDAQIQSQIDVLNQDYQLFNADTSDIPGVWNNDKGDMRIKFCLAKRTPNNEPTNGIDRIKTDGDKTFNDIFDALRSVKHNQTGGADAWDSEDYLNIWVCKIGGDILGLGTPPSVYPSDEQGIVIQYDAFGISANNLSDFNKGRSCTHEVGHYLNLLHLWGTANIGSCDPTDPGDYVADTPPQQKAVYGHPTFPYLDDLCSPNFPGIMINNFMGYANDAIMNMFTKGQVNRAKTALFNYRSSLLSSKGCEPVQLKNVDAAIKTISAPKGKQCTSSAVSHITLQNKGNDPLSQVDIKFRVDNKNYQTYVWNGHLESFDTAQITLPKISFSEGSHQLEVLSVNPNGSTDEKPENDTLISTFHLDPILSPPYSEGFESGNFPPEGWTISNPDHSFTWQKTNKAAQSGQHSIVMKNLAYQKNGPIDEIISPVFNISKDSAFLFFYHAAAVQSDPNGNNTFWDTLEVLVSFDCGNSGETVYKKAGKDLITTDSRMLYEFIPRAHQWVRDSIDLTPYIDSGSFRIIFRNISNFENNIYLDDIKIETKDINPNLIKEKVLIVPNPFSNQLQIQFLDKPDDLKAVSIYNTLGQLIQQKKASAINHQNRIIFHLKNLQAGVYFIKISFVDKRILKKVIKIE